MKRLLLVEDNRLERKMLLHLLKENLYSFANIDVTNDGISAIEYLSRSHYDLIITDLIMPKVDGIELIRNVKKKYPASKIIAISGSKPYYLLMAKKLGIEAVFTKPIDQDRFLKKIFELFNINSKSKIISVKQI
ncbi:MAG: response regulator [Bacteroidales bacterium]|nr:response regulator [Bacteroidales bacterium]